MPTKSRYERYGIQVVFVGYEDDDPVYQLVVDGCEWFPYMKFQKVHRHARELCAEREMAAQQLRCNNEERSNGYGRE